MDKNKYLEAGIIVNTHGVRGEVRIKPWADSPVFLASIKTLYIDEKPVKLISSKVHKSFLLASLEGVLDFDSAIKFKNKIVYINKEDVKLEDGRFFIADLIGLRAVDAETGKEIGIVSDVMSYPANNVYIIKNTPELKNSKEILIPAVPDFVKEINIDAGYIKFRLIEGMDD